jgi:putative spermidine/putrescine transport system ATP-binding protein
VLEATVSDPGNGELIIEGQKIFTAGRLESQKGDAIKIALRPEIISLKSEDPQRNQLAAVVDNVTFLGSIVRIQVKIGAHHLFFDTFNNPNLMPPKIGDKVTLYFQREACLVLGTKN